MFWKLFAESVIVQAVVTLLLIATICYMFIVGKEVPDSLVQITMLVVGFWFGSKAQQVINSKAQ